MVNDLSYKGSQVEISGLKELDDLLKELPAVIEGRVMRGALRKGQQILSEAVKSTLRQNGSFDTGALERSIKVRFRKKHEKWGWIRTYVIAGDKDAYYAHIVEFGSASFYTGKGKTVGKPYVISAKKAKYLLIAGGTPVKSVIHPGAKPKPFMRPAFDLYSGAAIDAVVNYLQQRIPKEIKKANKAKL